MEKREPGAGDTVKREEPRAAGSGDAAGAGGPGSAAGVGAKLSSHPKPPASRQRGHWPSEAPGRPRPPTTLSPAHPPAPRAEATPTPRRHRPRP